VNGGEVVNEVEIVEEPELTKEYLISPACMEELYSMRFDNYTHQLKLMEYQEVAKKFKIAGWKSLYTAYCKQVKTEQDTYTLGEMTDFKGQPTTLMCGEWQADNNGIRRNIGGYECEACCHPIMPVERLVNIDTGTEKMRIAYKKGTRWRNLIADKKTLASTNSIIELANNGIAVNSENSKYLIKYLHDIEHLNYTSIPERKSVGRLGWIDDYGFSPFVDDITFDGESSYKAYFESVQPNGDYNIWLDLAKEIRQGKYPARIILAASFASVLVKPLQKLPFFVHLWGGTETGKTVGLMLAASVWANPEVGRYIHSFNSTSVGREKSAAFVNSLPLILDELQVAKSDKSQFDKEIYALSEGTGRTRGTRNGGIEKNSTWANCILTNGEMPITNSASGGGAVNRILEIECKEKLFDNPQQVANTVRDNYGYAGKLFIEQLKIDDARAVFDGFYSDLIKNDTTEKQAMAAAIILTADTLATDYIFQDGQALTEENIVEFLSSVEAVSANDRAYQYLLSWISKNRLKLCGHSERIEVLGKLQNDCCYIMASVFNDLCIEGGFNPKPLLSYMADNGYIDAPANRTQTTCRINGIVQRCVKVLISGGIDNSEEDRPDWYV